MVILSMLLPKKYMEGLSIRRKFRELTIGARGITYADFEQLKESTAAVGDMKEQLTAARAEVKKASETLKNEQKQIDEYTERLNNDGAGWK